MTDMKLTDMKLLYQVSRHEIDSETVGQPCHVVRRLRRNVLQVPQEREEIGVGYLDATAECGVEAFQDVVCSVAVVAHAEPGRTN